MIHLNLIALRQCLPVQQLPLPQHLLRGVCRQEGLVVRNVARSTQPILLVAGDFRQKMKLLLALVGGLLTRIPHLRIHGWPG